MKSFDIRLLRTAIVYDIYIIHRLNLWVPWPDDVTIIKMCDQWKRDIPVGRIKNKDAFKMIVYVRIGTELACENKEL